MVLNNLLGNKNYSLPYKLQFVSLVLIALTLPFSLALNNISIGLLILSWLWQGRYAERLKSAFRNRLFLLFSGVFLIQLIGLLYTSNLEDGLSIAERKAALFVLPLVLSSSESLREKHLYVIVLSFVVACVFLVLHSSFILYSAETSVVGKGNLTEYIDQVLEMHHAYSGLYLVFALSASVYFTFSKYKGIVKYQKVLLFGTAILLSVFLILLAARTAVFTFFVLFVGGVVYYILSKKRKRVILAAIFTSIALVAVVLILPNTKSKIEDFNKLKGVHSPLTPRLIKWGCCIKVLNKEHAWFAGVGTGDVQDHLQTCYSEEKFWGERYNLNAHNEYLEELVRHGLLGLVIFAASLIIPLIWSIRKQKFLYVLFLVIFMVSLTTESVLSRQKGVVFFALFNSIFAFHYLNSTPNVLLMKQAKTKP